MNLPARIRPSEWSVLLLLAFSILWKGGKSLEATWLLALLASFLTISYWFKRGTRVKDVERMLELKQGISHSRNELPLRYWMIALVFIVWSILSYATSETKNYGLDEVMRSASYMLLFLWVARQQVEQDNTALEQWFPSVVSWTAIVACVVGLGVYVLQPVNRFVGTFFDNRFHTDYWPNAWAEYLLIAWPMMALLAWRQESIKRMWLTLVSLGIIIGAIFLSYSRGAVLALIVQVCVMMVLSAAVTYRDIRYSRAIKQIVKKAVVGGVFVCSVAAVFFLSANALRQNFFDVESVAKKITFTAAEGTSSINERAQFWEQAQTLALEKPILGWGPYSFRFVQPALMHNVLATSDHPHNVLLKLFVESGIVAMLMFAAIFGSVLAIAILSFFTARKAISPYGDILTITCVTAIVGVLLHNFIDYNLQFVSIGIACFICLGILVSPAKPVVILDAAESFRRWRLRRTLSHMEVFIACILIFITLWEGLFLATSSLGRHAMAAKESEKALRWFELSHGELFSRDLYLSEAQLYMDKKSYGKAQRSLDTYHKLNDHDPRWWKLQGELAMHMSDYDLATEALEQAYQKGKYTDLGITRLLLESARRSKKPDMLMSRKLEFDALYSEFAAAIERNEHFIALSHNVEELQAVSRLLGQLYPVDANRYILIARSAISHAKEEREKYQARSPGMLW